MPRDVQDTLHRATEALRVSGIMDGVLKTGDRARDFVLPSANGSPVSLAELRAHGPVVVSFFRGKW